VVHGCLPSAELARTTAAPVGRFCGSLTPTTVFGAVAIVYGFHCTPGFGVYASYFLVDVFPHASRLSYTCDASAFVSLELSYCVIAICRPHATFSYLLLDCSLFRVLISSVHLPPLKLHKKYRFYYAPKSSYRSTLDNLTSLPASSPLHFAVLT
jgi:hypothetical protein